MQTATASACLDTDLPLKRVGISRQGMRATLVSRGREWGKAHRGNRAKILDRSSLMLVWHGMARFEPARLTFHISKLHCQVISNFVVTMISGRYVAPRSSRQESAGADIVRSQRPILECPRPWSNSELWASHHRLRYEARKTLHTPREVDEAWVLRFPKTGTAPA